MTGYASRATGSFLDGVALLRLNAVGEPKLTFPTQSYEVPPNEMVVDTDDYVDEIDSPERDSVAIINPDNLDEAEQTPDKPLATDCESKHVDNASPART